MYYAVSLLPLASFCLSSCPSTASRWSWKVDSNVYSFSDTSIWTLCFQSWRRRSFPEPVHLPPAAGVSAGPWALPLWHGDRAEPAHWREYPLLSLHPLTLNHCVAQPWPHFLPAGLPPSVGSCADRVWCLALLRPWHRPARPYTCPLSSPTDLLLVLFWGLFPQFPLAFQGVLKS